MLGSWQCERLAGHSWTLLGDVMFRKLVDLFRRQKASAKEPVEEPLSINANGSHEKTEVVRFRFGAPIQRGRPIRNQPPPDKPGLYWIISKKTGKPVYIGAAKNIRQRSATHKRSGKLNSDLHHLQWQLAKDGATAGAIYGHEAKKIKKHRPRLNQRNGGAGPRWTIPAPAPNPVSGTAPSVIPSKSVP
jgi:hypothetical protein